MEPVNRKKEKDNIMANVLIVNKYNNQLFLDVNEKNKTGSSRAEPNRLSINYNNHNKKKYLNVFSEKNNGAKNETPTVRNFSLYFNTGISLKLLPLGRRRFFQNRREIFDIVNQLNSSV